MAKKKFIIIQPGTKLFPENGKKRVRVFQDDEYQGVPPGLLEELKEYGDTVKENTEAVKEQGEESEKAAGKMDKLKNALGKLKGTFDVEQSREFLGVLRDQVAAYDNLSGGAKEYQAAVLNIGALERERAQAEGQGNTARQEFIEAQIEVNKLTMEATEGEAKMVRGLVESSAAYLDNAKILAEREKKLENLNELNKLLASNTRKTGLAINSLSGIMNFAGFSALNFSDGIGSAIKGLTTLGLSLDGSRIEFQRATGAGLEQVVQMEELVERNIKLGITTAESTQAIGALRANMGSFVGMTGQAKTATEDQVVALMRLGASADAGTKSFDLLTRGMGMNETEALEATDRMVNLGQSLALPTGKLFDDFTKLGPKLARFGDQAEAEFANLQKKARELGIDVSEAFDIAEKFDTFEGAADMAGKLNAQLGLQINSVAMLGAESHADRIKLLRDQFKTVEGGFAGMHRRQRQAVAEMLGIDESMASKLFGSEIEYQKAASEQIKAKARAEELTKIQEKQAAILDNLSITMAPVTKFFAAITEMFTGPFGKGFAIAMAGLLTLVGIGKTIIALETMRQTMMAVKMAMTEKGIKQTIVEIAASKAKTAATLAESGAEVAGANADLLASGANDARAQSEVRLATAQGVNSAATGTAASVAFAAAIPMLALAAAILMIGAGIGIAAFGMAAFVAAFAELNVEQMVGAGLGAVALGFGLFFLTKALLALAPTMVIAYPVLLAFGAAIALIGIGIAAVAIGFAQFIASFAELGSGISVAAEGFEKITRVVEVVTGVDDSGMEKMDTVFNKITKVMLESNNANVPALTAIADAVAPAAGGDGGGKEKTIELKVNDRILGDVVVNIMEERYDLTPR